MARLDKNALQRIPAAIEADVRSGLYDGEVGLHEAVGFADRAAARPAGVDDVFWIFSTTKAFTNVLVLMAFDRGLLAPTTKVVDIIPEFRGRDRFRAGMKEIGRASCRERV